MRPYSKQEKRHLILASGVLAALVALTGVLASAHHCGDHGIGMPWDSLLKTR